MRIFQTRPCPLCGGTAGGSIFPYATLFNATHFRYLKCGSCASAFVDPVPDMDTFAIMYAKNNYHDQYYSEIENGDYTASASLLSRYLNRGALVLDYGCGVGAFLKAIRSEDFVPFGVEFDAEAAHFSSHYAGCEVLLVEQFFDSPIMPRFDAIHLGDVLAHLPDPAATLKQLLAYLRPGGILFVEGPLEGNPSPVFWAARLFGIVKRTLRPKFIAHHPPTRLFFTNAKQQQKFFSRVDSGINLKLWQVYETGWPYMSGNIIKKKIAKFAVMIGGRSLAGQTFGNRFRAIYAKR